MKAIYLVQSGSAQLPDQNLRSRAGRPHMTADLPGLQTGEVLPKLKDTVVAASL